MRTRTKGFGGGKQSLVASAFGEKRKHLSGPRRHTKGVMDNLSQGTLLSLLEACRNSKVQLNSVDSSMETRDSSCQHDVQQNRVMDAQQFACFTTVPGVDGSGVTGVCVTADNRLPVLVHSSQSTPSRDFPNGNILGLTSYNKYDVTYWEAVGGLKASRLFMVRDFRFGNTVFSFDTRPVPGASVCGGPPKKQHQARMTAASWRRRASDNGGFLRRWTVPRACASPPSPRKGADGSTHSRSP